MGAFKTDLITAKEIMPGMLIIGDSGSFHNDLWFCRIVEHSDKCVNLQKLDGSWIYAQPDQILVVKRSPDKIRSCALRGHKRSKHYMTVAGSDESFCEECDCSEWIEELMEQNQ